MAATQDTGPITIDDVRTALADTDPSTTNANKIRQIIGRGGFTTIQKHLETIRAERAPVVPGAAAPAPAAPREVLDALWTTAWGTAQAMTYGRLESLAAQRDAAQSRAAAQAADIDALTAELDAAEAAVSAITAERDAAVSTLQHDQEQQAVVLREAAQVFADYKKEAEAKLASAATAAELAARDHTIAMQTLQAQLDKHINEVVDLRGIIAHIQPVAAPAHTKAAAK